MWTETASRELWNSLFKYHHVECINEASTELQGFLMLMETVICTVKNLHQNLTSQTLELKKSVKAKDEEIAQLRENIKSLKLNCTKCSDLQRELNESRKRAQEVQGRMNSIAKILSHGDGTSTSTDSEQLTNLVSQMLYPTSPKRKKRPREPPKDENQIIPETACEPSDCVRDGEHCIPETQADFQQDSTPQKKATVGEQDVLKTPEQSPSIAKVKKCRVLWSSLNCPTSGKKTTPKKNLSADSYLGQVPDTPEKRIHFNLNIATPVKSPVASVPDNPLEDESSAMLNNSELERIWFGEEKREVKTESPKVTWKLKNTPPEPRIYTKKEGSKPFKQLKLGVVKSGKQVNVSQLGNLNEAVNNGKGESSKKLEQKGSSSDNDEDIIRPSPTTKTKKKTKRGSKKNGNGFAPMATSTQVHKNLDDSYDRIPAKVSKSPQFKYKSSPVRRREERAQLEGGDCRDCEEYYKMIGQNLDSAALKARMNACSRHRDKHKRDRTPPGFWDPHIPDTPESRAQGLYTSVYCFKDDEKK